VIEALELLAADGPHADHADELMLFGQFVGSWDVDAKLVDRDGTSQPHGGEWHFAWVLEGRAVQDVLVSPRLADRAPGEPAFEYGSTVRFYDPERKLWEITWITPVSRRVERLSGGPAGGGIVLEGVRSDGNAQRWTFADIAADSFLWRGYISADGGANWFMNEEMRATRRSSH